MQLRAGPHTAAADESQGQRGINVSSKPHEVAHRYQEQLPKKMPSHYTGEYYFDEAHQKEARESLIFRNLYFIKPVASKVVPDEHSCLEHNL